MANGVAARRAAEYEHFRPRSGRNEDRVDRLRRAERVGIARYLPHTCPVDPQVEERVRRDIGDAPVLELARANGRRIARSTIDGLRRGLAVLVLRRQVCLEHENPFGHVLEPWIVLLELSLDDQHAGHSRLHLCLAPAVGMRMVPEEPALVRGRKDDSIVVRAIGVNHRKDVVRGCLRAHLSSVKVHVGDAVVRQPIYEIQSQRISRIDPQHRGQIQAVPRHHRKRLAA